MNKKILFIVVVILIIAIIGGVIILGNSKNDKTAINNSNNSYIPDSLNVINENKIEELEDNSDIVESNKNPENVTIEILPNTVTNTSVEILITDNNIEHYGYGVEFRVQEKINNEWKDLDYVSENLTWISIAYELNEDNQLTQKLNIEEYYGKLSSGIYRIVKPVYDNEYIDIYSDQFEI